MVGYLARLPFSVRTLQAICLLAAIGFLILRPSEIYLLSYGFLVYAVFLIFGVAIGYHRGLSHRLLDLDSPLAWFSLAVGTLTSLGKPVEWALIHRLHHQHSDETADPHSPAQQGFWTVFLNRWRLSPETAKPRLSLVRDLVSSKNVQFFQKRYYLVIALYVLVLALAAGLPGVIFGYCWPVVLSVLATSLVNSVCHTGGVPRDSFWITLFTFGEGIHGRHHLEPKTINLSYAQYFDLSGWLLAKLSVRHEGVAWATRRKNPKQ
ncbi:MAG: fatty acid desaturase [Bdellovibrionales bacterium]|nr:fatty acid desaturase [Bdellovibrionales bacterium]